MATVDRWLPDGYRSTDSGPDRSSRGPTVRTLRRPNREPGHGQPHLTCGRNNSRRPPSVRTLGTCQKPAPYSWFLARPQAVILDLER